MTLAPALGRAPATGASPQRLSERYQLLVNALVWVFVACGAIALIEPSPYDIASVIALPVWLFGGFSVHRSFVLFYFLVVAYALVGFLALIPYWTDGDAVLYQYQTAYLVVTGLFFALFTSERSLARAEILLQGFIAGCLVAAAVGIAGYFDLGGTGKTFATYGRAAGTFKDPNVFGSYLYLGALYLMQGLLLGRSRHWLLSLAALGVIVAGIFLSFSRGSWGATIFAVGFMVTASYATAQTSRARRRIAVIAIAALAIAVLVVLALLSIEQTRELFLQRAALTQEYDQGETGRFGNQLRSLPLLLERFGGFGPLRFRLVFGLEPHNSYIGAFANGGWIGGLLFMLLVGVTSYIGVRVMFLRSPYQRLAQVFVPALIAFFLQAFQIDIDHWRHVWLMMGAVWGLEAARQRWAASKERAAPNAATGSTSSAAPTRR